MARKLAGAVLLGVIGAAYSYLYNVVDEDSRGLFVYVSLLTAVTLGRAPRGG
jgi:hypothetical protein